MINVHFRPPVLFRSREGIARSSHLLADSCRAAVTTSTPCAGDVRVPFEATIFSRYFGRCSDERRRQHIVSPSCNVESLGLNLDERKINPLLLLTRCHRCLVAGFFANVAKLSPDGRYRTVRDSTVVAIHPSSVLAHFGSPPEWILFNEISKTSQLFARDVSVIDPRYVQSVPHVRAVHTPITLCSSPVGTILLYAFVIPREDAQS